MPSEAKYQRFANDKRSFFVNVHTLDEAKKRASDSRHKYDFVATNEKLIRAEFDLLFNRLKQDDVNRDAFWLYCYYCAILLQNYYRAYGQSNKADNYLKLRIQIKKRVQNGVFPQDKVNNDNFIAYLAKKFGDELVDLAVTPLHIAKIRDKISYANLRRIYWFFCRTTVTKSFSFARDLHWLDKIGSVLGKNIDVDNIINILEKPGPLFKVFSVAFPAADFIIHAGMLLKHTLLPSKKEAELNDWKKRFYLEIYKRHANFLNDLVWVTVNLLTNYNEIFHISNPAAGWILAGFLFFDFCLIVWRRHLARKEYLEKRGQLLSDQKFYEQHLRFANPDHEQRLLYEDLERLAKEEIAQLDLEWKARDATFWFNATAALLLMAGFSASMIITTPIMVIGCYALCTFAMAMFMSDGVFYQFRCKSLLLEQAQLGNTGVEQAYKEYIAARNDFILTMAKNILIPALLITTYAICWQAALVLTAVLIGYQLWSAYRTYAASQTKSVTAQDKKEELGLIQNAHDSEQEEIEYAPQLDVANATM